MTENHKNYHWLAGQFRNKIINEEWLPSDKLPTERALSQEFGVTRERIRQIEAKTLRKLRHPRRSKKLKDYLE